MIHLVIACLVLLAAIPALLASYLAAALGFPGEYLGWVFFLVMAFSFCELCEYLTKGPIKPR